MKPRLRILMIAAEMAPFAKTGGLGDVIGALPRHIAELGHDVRVFVPKYGQINPVKIGAERVIERIEVPMDQHLEPGYVFSVNMGPVRVYFIASDKYLERDNIYGYPDDGQRFIFACRGALVAAEALNWKPDVIHCHDWHTGLVPNWLKTIYRDDPFYSGIGSLFTIHNLAYQGIFDWNVLEIAGIAEQGFISSSVYPERSDVLDFMARGIIFADKINTVSDRYAEEIITPEFGERLDAFLLDRKADLSGILNGIDVDLYDPATDPNIARTFDRKSFGLKLENKRALQDEAGLEPDLARPLAAVITRLSHQKGADIIAQIVPALTRLGAQIVVLGTGDADLEDEILRLCNEHAGAARAFIRFDPSLAQRIYAGADILLIPSRYEPCGLTQMIAMRYGTVPVVRATGGLADTVVDYSSDPEHGTGFRFDHFDALDFMAAVTRAYDLYRRAEDWQALALRCMDQDFSWRPSAKRYEELYVKLLREKSAGGAARAAS